jgi:hypothetical protein
MILGVGWVGGVYALSRNLTDNPTLSVILRKIPFIMQIKTCCEVYVYKKEQLKFCGKVCIFWGKKFNIC